MVRRTRYRAPLILGAAILGFSSVEAGAGTWVGPPGGNWNNPAHWNDGVVPPPGADAVIAAGPFQTRDMIVDAFYNAPVNFTTRAGGFSSTFGTLTISQNVAGSQVITPSFSNGGTWGYKRYHHSAGTLIVQNEFSMFAGRAFDAGYELSGTAFLSAGSFVVGTAGPTPIGVFRFNQSGGTFHTGSYNGGSIAGGTHTMSGGETVVAGDMIGIHFDLSGGRLVVGGMMSKNSFNSEGEFTLSGGTLEAGTFRGEFGYGATQTGGFARIDHLDLRSAGIYNLNGGSLSAGSLSAATTFGRHFVMGDNRNVLARFGAIDIGTGSGIDIGRGAVVVDYGGASPFTTLRNHIVTAYGGGSWSGTAGIGSRFANASTHGIGYAEASDLTSVPAVFGTVDADAVLLRLTRYGDADLSGFVNLDDFNRLATNFGASGATAVWSHGDFNYDANVNLQDFNLLAANFGLAVAGATVTPDDWAALASAIPEPAAPALFGVAASAAMSHQRRRRRCDYGETS